MELIAIARDILGYITGVGISLVLVPCGPYLLGTHLDWRFGQDRVPEALRTAAAVLVGIAGIVFAAWSNLYLAWVGKGGRPTAWASRSAREPSAW